MHAKRPRMHIKDLVVRLEFGGLLWKHQNISACIKSVRPCMVLQKRLHTHIKDPGVHSEFGGILWKHQNNSTCTKSVRLSTALQKDYIRTLKVM